jgi:hypothetical protein
MEDEFRKIVETLWIRSGENPEVFQREIANLVRMLTIKSKKNPEIR